MSEPLPKSDLADYLLDNYGVCSRGADCYHGKDARGKFNGCLRVGWRGRSCLHWIPVDAISYEDLAALNTDKTS